MEPGIIYFEAITSTIYMTHTIAISLLHV